MIPAFLRSVRRRLRGVWFVATLVWAAPLVAAAATVVVGLGWLFPWTWPETVALAVAVGAFVVVAVAAVLVRVSDHTAARAADRGLGSRDVLVTALEVDDGIFAGRIRARAQQVIDGADLRRALPVRASARRVLVAGSLGAVALIGGVVGNPQDDVRRDRAEDAARIADAAETVEDAASGLDDSTEADGTQTVIDELDALARALAETSTLEEAEELLDASEAALQAGLTPEALAQKAAVSGLERSLEATPLPGAAVGDDAAAQLDAAAGALDALDEDASTELAERLERLAATQAVGNPEAAGALARAAAALADGNTTAAAEALRSAGEAQRAGQAAAGGQDARRSALASLAEARGRLRGAGEGTAAGSGEGQGEGEGDGAGDGSGNGEGTGSGQGQGQGQGSGSPSGQVTGAAGGTGAGQGGQGDPAGAPGGESVGEEHRSDDPSLFDPSFSDGETLDVGGTSTGDEPGDVVGRGDGPSTRGAAFVPLSRAVERFREQVTAALDDPALSPSMRELVRAYFGRLTEGQ